MMETSMEPELRAVASDRQGVSCKQEIRGDLHECASIIARLKCCKLQEGRPVACCGACIDKHVNMIPSHGKCTCDP
jgi:hypothetical protein